MIRVSVVVPTYKRHDLLRRCLDALLAQDFAPDTYEVIVADNAGSEDTRKLVEALAVDARPTLRYIAASHARGPAAARNAGWRAARGDIIAFTDDDCVPDAGWLRAGTAAFADGVVAASGKLVLPLPPVPTDYESDAARLQYSEFVTANCFYRRDALAAIGGFDERFSMAWREDSDVYFSLLERFGVASHSSRFSRVPEATVIHPIRPAPWGVSLRQQRKNLFNALLYKKHPSLYRQMVQAAPPLYYYCIVALLLTALVSAVRQRKGACIVAMLLWSLMTGRFCARRLAGTSRSPSHIAEMLVTSALIPPLAVFWRLYGAIKFRVVFL